MDRGSDIRQIPVFGVEASIPDKCGGLSFDHIELYEQPELGVSIRYESPSFVRADAYLYDLGLTNITSDLRSSEVMQWFQQACENVYRNAQTGRYLDLETITSQFLHLPPDAPDPFCLWAAFSYSPAPKPGSHSIGKETSHIALRTDRGFINKVRYSYPYGEEIAEVGFYGYCAFLVDWTMAIQKFGCRE
jgi:hypothetical protein